MENLNVKYINDLIGGKTSIKVGLDIQTMLLLAAGLFLVLVLGLVVAKLITNSL